MDHLNTRTDLINFICDSTGMTSSIRRACHTGTVNVLGGFSSTSSSTGPGWIVTVTSVHGRTWFIAVGPLSENCKTYGVWVIDQIPWQFYMGISPAERASPAVPNRQGYSLFDGDDPDRAWLMKETARND